LGRFRDVWRNLDARGQLTIVGSGLAVLVVLFFLYRVASSPSYATLATGLDPADASEMTKALDSAGVSYRLASGGTELDVVKGQESQARVALAGNGLPKGGHTGFELFDKQSLGVTDFQQRINFQRALEGEVARTIEQIDGIRGAQVQLVLPQDQLFLDQGSQASAAVLLTGAAAVDGSTVRGIAHLVASSVEGLDVQRVTITDENGTLLWPTADGAGAGGIASKLEAEQQYSAQLSALANAMLVQTLGAGKADARVHATLNVDQTTLAKVSYAKKGVPLETKTEEETLTSDGSSAAAAAGTSSNVPSYATSGTSGGGTSDYKRTNAETTYGVDKTVEKTVIAPGAVERLDVAVLFDKSVPADQVVDLRNAVGALVGLDANRGDTISTATLQFAAPPKEETAAAASGVGALMANPIGLLKYVAIALGAGLFLFFMRRSLRRRESEEFAAEPTWLRQIEGAVPIAELNAGPARAAVDPAKEKRDQVKEQVEDIVKKEPEKVAVQVGQWLRE